MYDYFYKLHIFNENILWAFLSVLIILRPVGQLIQSNEIWNFETSDDKAGRMIGYLERLIIFFLLLNNALTTIGFVIAIKSITLIRFTDYNEEQDLFQRRKQIEYFLIGTLLSVVNVFVVHLLLQFTHAH